MSEACAWANDFWFETLGFPVLRVAKAVANIASRRISEKQGMRLVGECEKDYVCGPAAIGDLGDYRRRVACVESPPRSVAFMG